VCEHVRVAMTNSDIQAYSAEAVGPLSVPAVEMKTQRPSALSYRRPRGKAGREGEVDNVGMNKYSETEKERQCEGKPVREASTSANKPASTALLQIAIELKYTG